MPTDIIMPQMGESIVEGTITKWLKKPGDKVQRDEPLFEISTDKVDAEIPAPASGVLQEIKVSEGNTVQVNTAVGGFGGGGGLCPCPFPLSTGLAKERGYCSAARARRQRFRGRRRFRRPLFPARSQARPRAQRGSRKSQDRKS